MPPPAQSLTSRLFVGPALRTQPDRRLVALVRDGYELAFDEIVRRYAKPLGRYAASVVGARSEDVTQDAFSKALVALRRDGNEIELRPWLYRIVRNTALNDLRDRPPTPELLAEEIVGGRGAAEEVERREEIVDLVSRLRALPEPQRAAIVMRELEGLSHDEIASALGMSGGAARQMIYRARQALREGASLLLPIPVLRVLLEHGTEMAAGAGAAGAGGAAIATTASAGGAGGALKLGALAVVVAGSVGTGVALQENHPGRDAAGAAAGASQGASETSGPSILLPQPPEVPGHASGSGEGKSGKANSDREGEGKKGDGIEGNRRIEDGRGEGGPGRRGAGAHRPPRGSAPGIDRPGRGRHGGEHGGPHGQGRGPNPSGGPGPSGSGPQGSEGGRHRGPGGGGHPEAGGHPNQSGGGSGSRGGPGPNAGSGPGGGSGPEGESEPGEPPSEGSPRPGDGSDGPEPDEGEEGESP
jgi:RNA polymerase sigma factor (sigma-70 family)